LGPTEKKTPLIIANTCAPSRVDLVTLYEQLRRRVLDGGRGVPGCALLVRQGMKSWIESCRRVYRPSVSVMPHTPAVPVRFCGEFVQLIASMVLEICQQGAIR
jgi:hypothetical protein